MSAELSAKLDYVGQQLEAAGQRRAEVANALQYQQDQLELLQQQDPVYTALSTILAQISALESNSALDLLWGDAFSDSQAEQNRQRIEDTLADYTRQKDSAQQRIAQLQSELAVQDRELITLQELQTSLQAVLDRETAEAEAVAQAEQAADTAIAEPITVPRLDPIVLPWSNRHGDALRLRLIMLAALAASALLGFVVPRVEVPEPERSTSIEIPERLATLIVRKAPPPPPPQQQAPEEQAEPAEPAEPVPETAESEARKSVEKVGLLAFGQDFAEIMDASTDIKMGSQAAIIKQAPRPDTRPVERSLITSQVDFSASATASKTVRRTDAIGDRNTLTKVEFTHIETPEVAALDQTASGGGHSRGRSDEEIQVVFDRYKDALYRIYNRELRRNAFLKGRLVLQLTIETDGKVSSCIVESSNLDAKEFERTIVARVLRFNFGEKAGASPITLLYPIEFFPAS